MFYIKEQKYLNATAEKGPFRASSRTAPLGYVYLCWTFSFHAQSK